MSDFLKVMPRFRIPMVNQSSRKNRNVHRILHRIREGSTALNDRASIAFVKRLGIKLFQRLIPYHEVQSSSSSQF